MVEDKLLSRQYRSLLDQTRTLARDPPRIQLRPTTRHIYSFQHKLPTPRYSIHLLLAVPLPRACFVRHLALHPAVDFDLFQYSQMA